MTVNIWLHCMLEQTSFCRTPLFIL